MTACCRAERVTGNIGIRTVRNLHSTLDGATVSVPAERGSYPAFYAQLAAALQDGDLLPVDPGQPVTVLRIIEKIHGAG